MRILITSGPTRQYLDPVRYITNASSGRMGVALAEAVLHAGHEAVVISGPVDVTYPEAAELHPVESTDEMLHTALELFPGCEGAIGAAAPCDYQPVKVATHKLKKTGESLRLHLVETPDIMAALGEIKGDRWLVGFALETTDHRMLAQQKMERKSCDLIIVNGPSAIDSDSTSVEIMARNGEIVAALTGSKKQVARNVIDTVDELLM